MVLEPRLVTTFYANDNDTRSVQKNDRVVVTKASQASIQRKINIMFCGILIVLSLFLFHDIPGKTERSAKSGKYERQ